MTSKKKAKQGRKYPEGVGKRKILLILLNHPSGISEERLIDETKEKLDLKDPRSIKNHLNDLGPGRTVGKEWVKGEQYLIKIPSKFEPNVTKKKLIKLLETQGVEIDINDLPEENCWKPNLNRIVELFKYMFDGKLDRDDLQQLMQNDFVLNYIAEKQSSLWEDEGGEAFNELKKMLRLSPRMFESCLKIDEFTGRHIIDQVFISRDPSICIENDLNDAAYLNKYFPPPELSKEMKEMSPSDMINAYGAACEAAHRAGETHLARWDLFCSCVKTDDLALLDEKDYHELWEMFSDDFEKKRAAECSYLEEIERRVEDRVKRELSQQNREG